MKKSYPFRGLKGRVGCTFSGCIQLNCEEYEWVWLKELPCPLSKIIIYQCHTACDHTALPCIVYNNHHHLRQNCLNFSELKGQQCLKKDNILIDVAEWNIV